MTDNQGVVQYVGQTNNPTRRASEHSSPNSPRKDLVFNLVPGMVFDSKFEARMAEQAGIEYFNTLNPVNKEDVTAENPRWNNQRNEISRFNPRYYISYLPRKSALTNQFESFAQSRNFKPRQ